MHLQRNYMQDKLTDATRKKIAESLSATRERRKTQDTRIIDVKVNESKISKEELHDFYQTFKEGKWVRNSIIAMEDPFSYKYSDHKTVIHYDKDKNLIESPITMRSVYHRGVAEEVLRNIHALSKAKEKGIKTGTLKFTSDLKEINIKTGFVKIKSRHRISIPGHPNLPVYGLEQLDKYCKEDKTPVYEVTESQLIKEASGIHIHLGLAIPKGWGARQSRTSRTVGLDFKPTGIVTSDGRSFSYFQPEPEKIRKLQHDLARRKKGSGRYYDLLNQINALREKESNKKDEAAKQLVAMLLQEYDTIFFQDEMIAQWRMNGSYSSRIHHSYIGRVKNLLLEVMKNTDGRRAFCIQRGFPTTKLCHDCGALAPIGRFDTEFHCPGCGAKGERDPHAAETIRILGTMVRAIYLGEDYPDEYTFLNGLVEKYERGQKKLMEKHLPAREDKKNETDGNAISGENAEPDVFPSE